MQMNIQWPDSVQCKTHSFIAFLQKQANRLAQGHTRFGYPNRAAKYLTRLKKELRAYERTGNCEHLFNVANYACLESICPENPMFHLDNTVKSATRKRSTL